MPPNRFESEVESFLEGSHGDRTHIKRADHHTVTPLCGTLLLSRAYHDAPKYCATIETVQVKKDEVVFTGEIPARCIQAYRTDLAFYTNGQSVCLTELKGYQAAVGKPVIQPRRPNSRLDKVRHMFSKITG